MADTLIRGLDGGKDKLSSQQVGSTKAHRLGQDPVHLGQSKLLVVCQPSAGSVALSFCEKKIVRRRRKQDDRRIVIDDGMEPGRDAGEVGIKTLRDINRPPLRSDVLEGIEKLPVTSVGGPTLFIAS